MRAHLRAGIAIYNGGEHHAAHDAWEDHWLDLAEGSDDERFLHGLIQFTAAVFHARRQNWSGATGLAESGRAYLAGLPADYHDVNVGAVRSALAGLQADPERVERRRPPQLTHEGAVVTVEDLRFEATAVAADTLAEAHGHDEELIEAAVDYARTDIQREETSSPFVTLVFEFVREPANSGIILQRLGEHVDRRASRDSDVEGLFGQQ
jgi:hypothetical protein